MPIDPPSVPIDSLYPWPQSSTAWAHPISAVAFDMDGLMVNTEQLYFEVCQSILRRRGREYTAELRRGMMGLPGPKAFEFLIASAQLSDTVELLATESDEAFASLIPSRLEPMPGLLALLATLDGLGMPRCVATSSSRVFAVEVLEGIEVLDRVDFIITAEDVPRGKPFPDIYQGAAAQMGIPPQQMLVLEDSQHGSRAGVAAQACTIAVPGDHSQDHDFTGVYAVANSLADPLILGLLRAI